MKYRIMILASEKENYGSLYQFLTEEINDEIVPVEFRNLETLDEYVEKMLNDRGYAKSDFIIVQVRDYTVKADLA